MRHQDGIFPLGPVMAGVILCLGGVVVNLYHLGKTDFYRDDPARIGAVVRGMNQTGEWLVPRVGGEPRFDLPPLYLWLVKLSSRLGPDVTAFQTRLPGALSAIALLFLVAWCAYQHAARYRRDDGAIPPPEGFALMAGLMLASSPVYFMVARGGAPAPLYALLYMGAAACWAESLEARRSFYAGFSWRMWLAWGYLLAGLATLAQGPLVWLMLWIPYLLAARSYRLRGPDRAHLLGLGLGGGLILCWMLAVGRGIPGAGWAIWRSLWTLRLGSVSDVSGGLGDYLLSFALGTFPWVLLAGAMVWRVWRKAERSPTRVFWMWSLVANAVLLGLVAPHTGAHLLPPVSFIALLATHALFSWNYENNWAEAWRLLLRVTLIVMVSAGVFLAVLLNSGKGFACFSLIAFGWFVWALLSYKQGITYSPWITTVRLSSICILVFLAAELMHLTDWEPRKRLLSGRISFFERLEDHLDESLEELPVPPASTPQYFILDTEIPGLTDYYFEQPLIPETDLSRVYAAAGDRTYLLAREPLWDLFHETRLVPVLERFRHMEDRPVEALFRVLPGPPAATPANLRERLAYQPPLRLAILGNTGTRSDDQSDVARWLDKLAGRDRLDRILLLGNNIHGPNVFDHLDFAGSFEGPFRRLLKRGLVFNALLGHEDQSYGWFQARYPGFHMNGRRYTKLALGGGLVDCFMLDSSPMLEEPDFDGSQLEWLDQELSLSAAPWKVVCLHHALVSAANKGKPKLRLAERLFPLLDAREVDIVAWAGGFWYERLKAPGRSSMFFNTGWSGDSERARFELDPRLLASHDRDPGLLWIEFTDQLASFEAINDDGETVDQGQILKGSAVSRPATGLPGGAASQ